MKNRYLQNKNALHSALLVLLLSAVGMMTANAQNNAPVGAINGLFTVNSNGDQVYFSQGNLQYQASTNTWRFAENQWDFVGTENLGTVFEDGVKCDNTLISSTYSGWIDLFCWGTSGYDHGAVCYQPWSISENKSDYYVYGQYNYNLFDQTGKADWGYNPISNGGNQENSGWRTPTCEEWRYLFNTRSTASGIRFARAKVNNIEGLILLPDDWNASYYTLNNTNSGSSFFSSNIITASEWNNLERYGAIFLPATNYRRGTTYYPGSDYPNSFNRCNYKSSTYRDTNYSYFVIVDNGAYDPSGLGIRFDGHAVRLVRDVQAVDLFSIGVTINHAEGGVVMGEGTYEQNTTCTLTAISNEGYSFVNWTENGEIVSTESTYSFLVTGNRSLVANFAAQGESNIPVGAIAGLFSVGENTRVFFSQGNLQYIGSAETPYWKFADNQWDYLGTATGQNSTDSNVDRDLFGWGTSGYNHGATAYQPWSTSRTNSDYYAYGSSTYNLYDQTGQADWGYNPISNGGNTADTWRTLTKAEWDYVINTRTTKSGIRYAKATVNNISGVILLPDDWNAAYYPLSSTNSTGVAFSSNTITLALWVTLEQHGAVFLPTTGYRDGTSVHSVGSYGEYWSASYNDGNGAWGVYFDASNLGVDNYYYRYDGRSVRLVRSSQNNTFSINATPNPAVGGEVSGEGIYEAGVECTLMAMPSTGYIFVNWTENGEIVSANAIYTFTVTSNRTLVANFASQGESIIPEGAIAGVFSVGENTQVFFSQGNLQYIGSAETPYWKFADNQWDYLGNNTGQSSSNQNVDRDLFGWGTSGFNHGAVCYQPWSTSELKDGYHAYGDIIYNLYDQTGLADWGYNAISNGGNQTGQWRTLTQQEWDYLFNTRTTSHGFRYAKAELNDVKGLILLPDNWDEDYYYLNNTNTPDSTFDSNIISLSQWPQLEQYGAVFLPASGSRQGTQAGYFERYGFYWSSSQDGSNTYGSLSKIVVFDYSRLYVGSSYRSGGHSVRLVHNVIHTVYNINVSPNPMEGGVIMGSGSYEHNATCSLVVVPNEGYTFVNWTENGEVVSTESTYSFTVAGNRTLVANFTVQGESNIPVGAIPGLFSVGENTQVYFSQGNLQYIGSAETPYWKFADNQWDCLGATTGQNSSNANVDRDLFGWGTSGYNHGAIAYQPWSTSRTCSDYYVYGSSTYNLYDQTGKADWGYNAIDNGGNTENIGWRTPTHEEWDYLINNRNTVSNIRFAKAKVNNVNGIILLPDNWMDVYFLLNNTNTKSVDYSTNTITSTQWLTIEQHGAVFLPAAGYRDRTSISCVGSNCEYWSASYNDNNGAYGMAVFTNNLDTGEGYDYRYNGYSVRLVRSVQTVSYGINATPNPAVGGEVSGGGIYEAGTECMLTAIPSTGYTFVNWTENNEIVSTNATYTFTVTGNRTLVANFAAQGESTIPEGALNGVFSVGEGTQVYFSQGNLQYIGSTSTWKFADHQWDIIGSSQGNSSQSTTRDLLGWGTSGYNHEAVCYQPWSTSSSYSDYYAYGSATYNLFDQTGKADWGYNAISNGGNQENSGWRTLTHEEWVYVFNTRNTSSGIRYAKAKVNNVNGVILLPDDWNNSYYSLSNTNSSNVSFSSNTITSTQWNTLEQHGAVFLPAAGHRGGTSVYDPGSWAGYWSASYCDYDNSGAWGVNFSGVHLGDYVYPRRDGQCVRLVRSTQNNSFSINATPNPAVGGEVSGEGLYEEGTECALTATPSVGWTFANWTEGGVVVSTDVTYSFVVSGDRDLVANFIEQTFPTITHWTPESYSFEDNMTFTAVIQINGEEQHSDQLEVGAFCGEQCRGSQIASFFEPTQRHLVQLTIFGENGDELTFKLYDHAIEQELEFNSPDPVSFNANGYGSLANPFVLNFTSFTTHLQTLVDGWNWWSTYVELNGNDGLAQLENSLGDNGLIIKSRNDGYVEPFEYNGTLTWYGTLNAICNEQFYKINTLNACEASLTGLKADLANHPITIYNGWNWIGFPSQQSVSVSTALSGFNPEPDDIIKGRNGYASFYSANGYHQWYGTLNSLEPGQGYMYQSNSNEPKTLTYNTGREETVRANVTPEHNYQKPQSRDYADNMTLTAVVELNGEELLSDSYELAAFVGDECRGSVKLMHVEAVNRYIAFLTVFGTQGEELSFRLTDGVASANAAEMAVFVADGTMGSISSPFVLRFGNLDVHDTSTKPVTVYPNPSSGVFVVEGQGIERIEVYNTLGQCLYTEKSADNILHINLQDYADGVYLLRVITNNGVSNHSIVKQ